MTDEQTPTAVPGEDPITASATEFVETSQATPETAVAPEAVPMEQGLGEPDTPIQAEAPAAPEPPAMPETPVAKSPEPVVSGSGPSDADLFEAALASMEVDEAGRETTRGVSKGDRIEAKVIQVEKDRVFVDLGTKAEGVLPLSELSESALDSAVGVVKPGDTFEVIVVKTGSAEGNAIVSKRKADFDQTWQRILDSFEEGTVFQAQVLERVKGGLVVDIGVRGFVPATHVGNGRLRNIEKYVGQTLPVKIIEVDRDRKKVVLSNKAAEDENRDSLRKNIFDTVKTGDVLEGTVRRLTDYGAFIDLGGIDGLLHISEMSWYRIDHPREVLKEGDDIKVQVLRLDPGGGRVSLGLRQVLPDPWNLIKENYKQGSKISCSVSRLVQKGAFVKLPEGAEAFLPLSEMANKPVKKPSEAVNEGDDIEPTIIDLRPDERRMVLSLRDADVIAADAAERRAGQDRGQRPGGGRGRRPGGRPDTSYEPPAATMRAPTGGATIGERLGMLKGMLKQEGEPASEEAPASEPEAE